MPKTKITAGQLLFNAARDGDVEGLRSALGKRAPTDYKDAVSGMSDPVCLSDGFTYERVRH